MNEVLIYFSIKYDGDWNKIFKALEKKEKIEVDELNKITEKLEKKEWIVLTILQDEYPLALKNGYKPPFVIWMRGNTKNIYNKLLCVTGQDINEKTEKRINTFMPKILEHNYTIISCSYKGVDKYVLESSKSNVIVLADGLDNSYLNHDFDEERDLLITEYPMEVHVTKERLKNRNRIVAALGESILLFSSEKHGKINHLVSYFLNMGKDVYCLPGEGDENDGNCELIKQGASLVTTWSDIK